MSLDQNLFTLTLTPLAEDPSVIDLIDPNGIAHYRKQRVPGSSYRAEVYGALDIALTVLGYLRSHFSMLRSCVPGSADQRVCAECHDQA